MTRSRGTRPDSGKYRERDGAINPERELNPADNRGDSTRGRLSGALSVSTVGPAPKRGREARLLAAFEPGGIFSLISGVARLEIQISAPGFGTIEAALISGYEDRSPRTLRSGPVFVPAYLHRPYGHGTTPVSSRAPPLYLDAASIPVRCGRGWSRREEPGFHGDSTLNPEPSLRPVPICSARRLAMRSTGHISLSTGPKLKLEESGLAGQ